MLFTATVFAERSSARNEPVNLRGRPIGSVIGELLQTGASDAAEAWLAPATDSVVPKPGCVHGRPVEDQSGVSWYGARGGNHDHPAQTDDVV